MYLCIYMCDVDDKIFMLNLKGFMIIVFKMIVIILSGGFWDWLGFVRVKRVFCFGLYF